ncbi:type I pullulanase [Ferruginibacter lapsinanis]|uniref:type I pullulanase n=1 Tax=Ferruginibacter lapsinanis TaxID=563172 RepID=UPI001E2A1F9E|nr:type I pullulanase [Ferruginibacter lapsinanis]UEG50789.1 type I pullulanase [Ferruginibacter lapsinanis]
MKHLFLLLALIANVHYSNAQMKNESFPTYTGKDLGLTYTPVQSKFRIWAPTADRVQLKLYRQAQGGKAIQSIYLTKAQMGTWTTVLTGDHLGTYYTFSIEYDGKWLDEVPDPYAKAVGINGKRAMVVDLKKTNPIGWQRDRSPVLKSATDAVIYELHVRDASIAANSGIKHKGKFIGLAETGTKNEEGLSTGLDHLTALGVTHVHLLPCFDFYSDEDAKNYKENYNWGYNPQNYNVPEGMYATDATDGNVRIREFKQLIKAFHQKGLGVVMDVVYNHTGQTDHSNFNQLVPGYYYRHTGTGKFSDATACGNETASEKSMMQKFMIESVVYWAKEYHVDGFRFDLMGVHDIETMNLISAALHKINPGILLYGEGWTAGSSPLPDSLRALKKNVSSLNGIAVFSDDIRDGIKGSWSDHTEKGFVSSKAGTEASIQFGIAASCKHPQIDYSKVNYSSAPYAKAPGDIISYAECHDNHTLWDKLAISAPDASVDERKEMHKLALSIVLTSQGISFLHAGTEFLRSKKGVENSYNSPDSINEIDWSLKTKNKDVFTYVQQLIQMRKAHPAFRMQTTEQLQKNLTFLETDNKPGIVGYQLDGADVNDSWRNIQVWFNGGNTKRIIPVTNGSGWKTAIINNQFVTETRTDILTLLPHSCSVIYKD